MWKSLNAAAAAPATSAPAGTPPPPTASVLPPIAQPAPAAAPAAPVAPRRRAPPKEAAPAATTVITPTVETNPAPAPAATTRRAPAQVTVQATAQVAALPGFLALLQPKNAGPSALQRIVDGKQAAGEPNLFPTVYLVGGEQGGQMAAHAMNPEGSDADLPVGKDPVNCVLLAIRFEVLFWPKAWVRGIKMSPRGKAIINYDEIDAIDAMQLAVQRYAFRSRAAQDKYDVAGHPSALIECLVYDTQAGLYCYQSAGTYDSMFRTSEELALAFPNAVPTPIVLEPKTYTTPGSKTQAPWPEHFYHITQDANSDASKEVQASFNKFITENGSDPELLKAIAAWSKHTLSADQLDCLRQIASL